MQKNFFNLLARTAGIVFLILGTIQSQAQPTGMHVEVVEVHNGVVEGYDLEGYVTYELYIDFTNEDDFLSAVYGFEVDGSDPDDIISAGDCMEPDSIDVDLVFDCDLFHHPEAGPTSEDWNCIAENFFPAIVYDSYLTIGKDCSSDPGFVFTAATCPSLTFFEDWEPNGLPLFIDDGTWFTTYGAQNGYAGQDLKVKIAQFTTCGNIDGCFWVQVFCCGDQDSDNEYNEKFCFTQENPCIANDLDPTITVLDDIDCFGELAEVQVGEGVGNGNVFYQLLADGVPQGTPQVNDNTFEDLEADIDYIVAMYDELGCIDTSQVFNFIEPPLLQYGSTLISDVECFGDLNGEILNQAQGGTTPYQFILNGDVDNAVGNNESFDQLDCGTYDVELIDANGCGETQTFEVSCPEELAIDLVSQDIDCFQAMNGSITGSVTGGTGTLEVIWTCQQSGDVIQQWNEESPIDISILNLGPCDYDLFIEDDNGCQVLGLFNIFEPEGMTTTVDVQDVSCNGQSDGEISINVTGGTPDYTFECEDLGGNPQPFVGLPAGTYVCTTTDDSGCFILDTVMVEEPPGITFTSFDPYPATCNGLADGGFNIVDLAGGVGALQVSVNPTAGTTLGDGVVNMPAGTYNVLVTDTGNGCVYSLGDVTIEEPGPITIDPVVTDVTCFGFDDGSITVNCGGGTGDLTLQVNDSTIACGALYSPLPPDIYNIVITDENGCADNTIVQVDEPDTLVVQIVEVFNISCGGDCNGGVELGIDGGTGEYAFFLDDQQVPFDSLFFLCAQEGYEICVLDENACEACELFDVLEPEPITFDIAVQNVTCTGMEDGGVAVTPQGGTGPITLQFDPPSLDITELSEGTYGVYGTDSVGCESFSLFTVEADIITDLAIDIFTSPLTCWNTLDGTATAAITGGEPPFSIAWGDDDLQTTTTAVGLDVGEYYVIVEDSQGCQVDSTATISPNVGCFFIATALTPNGDGVNDEWIVGGLEYYPNAIVQVYNRWGQLIFESRGYDTPWDGTYAGNKVATQDYYFIINYADDQDPITGTVTVKY